MPNTRGTLGVKKILMRISLVAFVLLMFFIAGCNKKDNVNINTDEQVVYQNTISISRAYVALRIKTDKILIKASDYPDYNTWNEEMTELINNWKNLEEKASILEEQANFTDEEKISFKLVNEAKAYSKSEISNVFDKAPAGKKIKTLAKFLGVDAKRAFKILKSDQEFVKADAWNEAGDTFKTLETSAVVIKDGCKVAGFVGALVISGGAAGAAVGGSAAVTSAGGALVATVVGTDLILEVSEDTATIALGDKNKTTKYISKLRSDSYMEPAAAVLSLTSVPDAEKADLVLMQAEALRSALQDKKILGINLPAPNKKKTDKVEVSALDKNDLKDWEKDIADSTEDGMDGWQENVDIIEGWLDDFDNEMVLKEDEEDIADDMGDLVDDESTADDLEEWLDGFENMDDWMDEFEEEEALEEEEEEEVIEEDSKSDNSSKALVDGYMTEMQGREMNDTKVLMEYGNKFEELYAKGSISREEQDALMVEASRLNEEKAQEERNIEEQEDDLLAENKRKAQQIDKERPDTTNMQAAESERIVQEWSNKHKARQAWLKTECAKIYSDDPEEAENCYYRGR